jgi:hypothetical protein
MPGAAAAVVFKSSICNSQMETGRETKYIEATAYLY